ncbi:hypothetical protein F2P81_020665 [Scophthalmus maximus]|uniref:Uncharacterized protein n=1 Tax=Scophthalmus maximus TaxID=52904 RepID=A0A6A4SAV7_SCOMX|nr:hypothetical protein F2P81_020665 [Scophthalmus maximus]
MRRDAAATAPCWTVVGVVFGQFLVSFSWRTTVENDLICDRLMIEFNVGPVLLPCPENVLQAWGEAGGGDCCETTFIEGFIPDAAKKEALLFTEGRFPDDAKIHTLSYDIDDDDDDDEFQELEVKTVTK